jgi:hypothetical protein
VECRREFTYLLMSTAQLFMLRRGSRTLDESDMSNAHQHLLASHGKDWLREVIAASVILFGGGGVLALGINLMMEEKTRLYGIAAAVLGLIIGGLGFLFQHYPFRSR